MKKILIVYFASILALSVCAKIHIDIADEYRIETSIKSVPYADKSSTEIKQSEKIQYVNKVTSLVNRIEKIENIDEMLVLVDAIGKIPVENYSSQQIYEIMEIMVQKCIDVGAYSYKSECIDTQNEFNVMWYDYHSLPGTGIWAVMKKAKYKMEKGEDISNLYRIFIKMMEADLIKK